MTDTVPRGRPPIVGIDAIVTAALALIDRDGIDRCSVRRVAESLGIANMTVYGHVADKDELLRLVVDRVFGDVVTDDLDDGAPLEVLGLLSRRVHAAFLAHPAVCPLLARPVPIFGVNGARVLDVQFGALARLGLTPPQMLDAYGLFLTMQLGAMFVEQVGVDRVLVGDLQDALAASRAAGATPLPHLAAAASASTDSSREDRFTWMLDVLTAGIAAVDWPSGPAR